MAGRRIGGECSFDVLSKDAGRRRRRCVYSPKSERIERWRINRGIGDQVDSYGQSDTVEERWVQIKKDVYRLVLLIYINSSVPRTVAWLFVLHLLLHLMLRWLFVNT